MTQPAAVPDRAGISGERTSVIVVGYSSKPEGRAALHRAMDEARLRHAELIIVPSASEAELATLTGELAESGVPHRITDSDDSSEPAEGVLRAASENAVDLIVIGLRRRSPVGKLLLGSNAQRVLLDASCPVLAVKAEPTE